MEKQTNQSVLLRWMDKVGQGIEFLTGAICVGMFAGLIVVIMLGVVFRYIVVDPLQWSEELARFLMLWIGFLAMNIATRQDQHLKIDTLVERFPRKLAFVLEHFGNILIICFLLVLIVKGYRMTMGTMMTASSMRFSMFWVYMSVPLGAGLSLVQLVLNMITRNAGRRAMQ